MQVASEETVLGDFADASFRHFGVTSRFYRKDGGFFVHTEAPDGALEEFEVKYTLGVEPLQQYLIKFSAGRLQSLWIAWDTQRKRWFHLYPDERIAHDDPLHWTGRYQNASAGCVECHVTDFQKGYDPQKDSYRTGWVELGVGCEACHGPGGQHLEWARAGVESSGDSALLINFRDAEPRYEVDTCAPCHARRHRVSARNSYGQPLLDDFIPETLREGLYHADGQILEEVYVYGSFLQSKMYRAGVRCGDCHDPHDLSLRAQGNALCKQCHGTQPPTRFSTLAARNYDTPAHHFHAPGTPGSSCLDCHMPTQTYMIIDPRHDHSFRVPRPDLTLKLATPNACNACHTERSAQWALDSVENWYGPERQQAWHYGEAIAAGRARARDGQLQLSKLAADKTKPAIARATALELLRGYGPEAIVATLDATRDEDPLIRATAVDGLDRLSPQDRFAAAVQRLEDPSRAVRIEAARVLASVSAQLFSPSQRRAFAAALAEYRETQRAQADLPAGHLNLAVIEESMGQPARAEHEYHSALRLDPGFLPARFNLANLYNRQGRNAEAEAVLREGLERAPGEGELHYSLALLLAEERRLEEADSHMARATELLRTRARPHYNRALLLQQLGRRAEAEGLLLEAHALDARDPDIVYALTLFYAEQEEWSRALPYARELTQLVPEAPGPRQLLQRIEQELKGS